MVKTGWLTTEHEKNELPGLTHSHMFNPQVSPLASSTGGLGVFIQSQRHTDSVPPGREKQQEWYSLAFLQTSLPVRKPFDPCVKHHLFKKRHLEVERGPLDNSFPL